MKSREETDGNCTITIVEGRMVQENGPGAGTKVFLKDHEEVKDDGANESRVLKNGVSEEYIAKICK